MGFHWPELLAVGMIALVIFGPRRLPEMGNALGRALAEFKRSMADPPAPSAPSEATVSDREGR